MASQAQPSTGDRLLAVPTGTQSVADYKAKRVTTEEEVSKQVEKTVADKDVSLATMQVEEAQRYLQMEDRMLRLIHGVRSEAAARQHADEVIQQSLAQVKDTTTLGVRQERSERQSVAARLERQGDASIADARGVLAEDVALQQEGKKYTRDVGDEICHLYSDLEKERRFRVEAGEKLAEGVRFKLGEIREAIEAEQHMRLESQTTLLELFGQMGKKLEHELTVSRKEREVSVEHVMRVLESVLPQMDKSAASSGKVVHNDHMKAEGEASRLQDTAVANMKRRTVMSAQALNLSRSSVATSIGSR